MKLKQLIPAQLIPYLLLFILLGVVLIIPAPNGSRTSTNSCTGTGCHNNEYELFVDITTYNVSSFINEDWRQIQCNFSITGNMKEKLSTTWVYYKSNITITASSNNGLLEIQNSPVYFNLKGPGFNGTANFTARGIGNGSESIRFEVRMVPWHKSINCMRTEIINAPTFVKIKVPPMISNGFVTPTSGSIKMKYIYEVTYTDVDGDPPEEIICRINNKDYNMSVKDGIEDNITTGEIYDLELLGTTIGMGSDHMYYFIASDGKFDAIGDTVVRYGPKINSLDSPPSCEISYPLDGIHSGELNISGKAVDLDMGEDIEFVELSLRDGPWVFANGTNFWYIYLDLFKWSDGQFKINARAFNGVTYSDIAESTVSIDNSFSNSPPILEIQISNNTVVGPYGWINGTLFDPELPDQDIIVLIGLNYPPNLLANISKDGIQWLWSIRMNFSELDEGEFELFALAKDPYVECNVKKVTLILDKPNIRPGLNIDEVPEPLWGTQDITGTIVDEDNHEIDLKIYISFDNIIWHPANITGGNWKVRFNFSYFEEREYTLYIKATDLEDETNMELSITILGPYKKPIIIDILPISPVTVNVDENLTFTIFYRAGDHRGTTAQWLVDSIVVTGKDEDNITELDINFSGIGDHEVTIIISNAKDPELFSTHSWKVDVMAVLKLQPLSETLINSIVGEVIILQFGVLKGEVKEAIWTINGETTDGGEYLYYTPETPGKYVVKVSVIDNHGNVGFIEYTIEASKPPGSEVTGETEDSVLDNEKVSKRTGLFIIVGVGVFLIVVIIISILLIVLAIRKNRQIKVKIMDQVPTPESSGVKNPQQALTEKQSIQPLTQTPKDTITFPNTQPTDLDRRFIREQTPTTFFQPQNRQQAQPAFTRPLTCPYCHQTTQYYPEQNGNWCSYCQRFV